MGRFVKEGTSILYKASAESDSTCPIGADIPWFTKTSTIDLSGQQEIDKDVKRDKDFQLTCLGDRSDCCLN